MKYISEYESPLGKLILISDGESLNGLCFDNKDISKEFVINNDLPIFQTTKTWLDIYFSGNQPNFIPLIKTSGSDFRKFVGDIMLSIPFGQTVTYGEIAKTVAKKLGKDKMSAQAVGGAVGHNPVPIIIPCHRVIGANGNLTGYGGGIERKLRLLKLEKVDTANFFIPKNHR